MGKRWKSDDQPLDLSKFSGTFYIGTWGAAGPRFPGRSERGSWTFFLLVIFGGSKAGTDGGTSEHQVFRG